MVYNNISELVSTGKENTSVTFCCLLSDKKTLQKNGGGDYLSLTFQDKTGTINFPVWDEVAYTDTLLEVGKVYQITGKYSKWNENPQIKNAFFAQKENPNMNDFIPSYEIQQCEFDMFADIINGLSDPYRKIAIAATGFNGYNKDRWQAFTECVSAVKHHGNKRGALFLHTLNVTMNCMSLVKNYYIEGFTYNAGTLINEDRLVCCAIMHDLMKVKEYEYETCIKYKENILLNHIVYGVTYLKEINEECGNILTEQDIELMSYSLLSHHGQYGPYEPKSLEDIILHTSDLIDAKIVEQIEKTV